MIDGDAVVYLSALFDLFVGNLIFCRIVEIC